MSERIAFTALTASDREPIARLLHRALVHWYESRLGQGSRFGDSHEPFTLFPDVYEALDPGECVTARTASGEIVGVCFSHERETHVSVGIVATSPDAGGRGIAKKMMSLVLDKAKRLGKPARLVSSLLNLDSFSLYTRLGFVPGAMFQDLLITVPETEHNSGETKSIKHGIPWEVVWKTHLPSRTEAIQLEIKIKKRGAKRFLEDLSSGT